MFTPEINFLKERPQEQITQGVVPVTDTGRVSTGVRGGSGAIAIGALIAVTALGIYAWANVTLRERLANLREEEANVTTELTAAQQELQRLQALKAQLDGINAQKQAFSSFFSQIQPWSAVLQDLRSRVPTDVWITSIQTQDQSIAVQGSSLTFDQINDFLLTLLDSPFVQSVQLTSGQKVDGSPTRPSTVNYGLSVNLKPLDLPSPELRETLEANGSIGLAEKVSILRDLETSQ